MNRNATTVYIALILIQRSDGDVFVKIGFSSMGLPIINFNAFSEPENIDRSSQNFKCVHCVSKDNFSALPVVKIRFFLFFDHPYQATLPVVHQLGSIVHNHNKMLTTITRSWRATRYLHRKLYRASDLYHTFIGMKFSHMWDNIWS